MNELGRNWAKFDFGRYQNLYAKVKLREKTSKSFSCQKVLADGGVTKVIKNKYVTKNVYLRITLRYKQGTMQTIR